LYPLPCPVTIESKVKEGVSKAEVLGKVSIFLE
jgi:hypothetical protein